MRAQAKELTPVGQKVARQGHAGGPRDQPIEALAGIGLDFVFPYWQNVSVERYEKYIDFAAIVL
jgi:hypothetical protein